MRLVIVFAVVFAGCTGLDPTEGGLAGTGEWKFEVAPSMAPDYTGEGPSYPVLIMHAHQTQSQRVQDENQYIVCADILGQPLVLHGLEAADMAPCPPSVFDEATGRVYLDNETFPSDAPAVGMLRGCGGQIFGFPDNGLWDYQVRDRTFRVSYDGGFAVDDRRIEPGTQLKISYTVNPDDDYERYHVKLVFDAPGEWLHSMVGPDVGGEIQDPPPEQGAGKVAFIDVDATTLDEILGPLVEVLPATAVESLRIVRTQALTEVRAVLLGDARYEWYNAAMDNGSLRMLVNITSGGTGVGLDEVLEDYNEFTALPGAGGLVTSYQLLQNSRVVGTPVVADPVGDCNPCHYLHQNTPSPDWYWVPAGQLQTGGLSLRVDGYEATGAQTVTYATR